VKTHVIDGADHFFNAHVAEINGRADELGRHTLLTLPVIRALHYHHSARHTTPNRRHWLMLSQFAGLWRNHNFLRLWAGDSVFLVGARITDLALPLTATLVLHASSIQMGVLGANHRFACLWGTLVPQTGPAR
jgi:hypothetical protein